MLEELPWAGGARCCRATSGPPLPEGRAAPCALPCCVWLLCNGRGGLRARRRRRQQQQLSSAGLTPSLSPLFSASLLFSRESPGEATGPAGRGARCGAALLYLPVGMGPGTLIFRRHWGGKARPQPARGGGECFPAPGGTAVVGRWTGDAGAWLWAAGKPGSACGHLPEELGERSTLRTHQTFCY